MPIEFDCPHCNEALSLWDELAGKQGTCPKCKEPITVPGSESGVTMPCPKCEADIPAEAVLCTSCGYSIKGGGALQTRIDEPGAVEQVAKESAGALVDFLWQHKLIIIGIVVFVAAVLSVFAFFSKQSIHPTDKLLDEPAATRQ